MFIKFFGKQNYSDQELMERYRKSGDQKWLGILLERYSGPAYGVCLKYLKNRDDSQDALLNVFEKILKEFSQHTIDNFPAWLHTVVKNHCLMRLRATKNIQFFSIDQQNSSAQVMEIQQQVHLDEKDDEAFTEIQLQALEKALDLLNEEQALCLKLFYLQEMSYKQIQAHTQMDYNQVKTHIQNGKRKLKIILEKNAKSG